MARKKKNESINDFIAYAKRNSMTYAQAQIKETFDRHVEKMVVPEGYKKAGDRRKEKAVMVDECKDISESGSEIGQDHSEQDG